MLIHSRAVPPPAVNNFFFPLSPDTLPRDSPSVQQSPTEHPSQYLAISDLFYIH